MGSRGPLKTDAETLKLRGSRRAEGRKASTASSKKRRAPPCPKWLSKEQRAERRKVIRDLKAAGTLHRADRHLVTRYAVTRVRWRKNVELLNKLPLTTLPELAEKALALEFHAYTSNAGDRLTMPTALVAIVQKLESQLLAMEKELGLTPAARRRLEISDETGKPVPALAVRQRA